MRKLRAGPTTSPALSKTSLRSNRRPAADGAPTAGRDSCARAAGFAAGVVPVGDSDCKGEAAAARPRRLFGRASATIRHDYARAQDRIMVAEFRGPSPHDLGTAELATVQVLEENIEVMLHLLDDWHRPMGPVVRVQMTADVARALAERLTNAAAQAEPGE